MKKFYYILAAIAVIGMLFVGCPNETNGQNDSNSSEKNGDNSTSDDSTFGLLIQLHGMSRAVTYYTEDDVTYYSIALSLNNQSVSNVQGQPGEIVKVSLQTEGTYTITVSAYNAAGTLIGGGFGQKAISKNDGFISVTIEITPSVKSITADLSIDIIWQHLTDPSADSLKPSYLVVFYPNGGSGTMERMLCEIGKEYTLPECDFTAPSGMKFNGWTVGASGEKFTDLSETNHDVVVVSANWIKVEYNIIYNNLQDGTTDSPTTYDIRDSVTLSRATREGWCFAGWYDNAACNGDKITSWSSGDHTGDLILYAKWFIEWWETSNVTTATLETYSYFPYGFKFTTKFGWSSEYIASSHVWKDEQEYNKITLDPITNTTAVFNGPYNSSQESDLVNAFEDNSTKAYIDEDLLIPGQKYTLTFITNSFTSLTSLPDTEEVSTITLTTAADDAVITNILADQDNDSTTDIYICGANCGSDWASNTSIGNARKLKVENVSDSGNTYSYTWQQPISTVKVTLKITLQDNSVLYLTNVPVKQDGTTVIDGSIYGWAGGTAVIIAKKSGETAIVGGEYDAAATTANADWAISNFRQAGYTVDNHTPDADDVLQLSIDGNSSAFVPYVKGEERIYNWSRAFFGGY